MIYLKYNDFINKNNYRIFDINENIQLTKKHIRDKVISTITNIDELSTEEVDKIVKDSIAKDSVFKIIGEMLKKTPGYVYSFYRFMEDGISQDELVILYQRLIDNKQFLNKLTLPFDKYGDLNPSEYNNRVGYEVLTDDLDFIELDRIASKFVTNFTPELKKSYNNSSSFVKEKIRNIAKEFTLLGMDEDTNRVDPVANKILQRNFTQTLKRYDNVEDLIVAAIDFIKVTNNSGLPKFLRKIDKINAQYGILNGIDIVYNQNHIIIVEVKSFQANRELNANTSHCIATTPSRWDEYVGDDNLYNKQYYIYNFNLEPTDSNSVIGITIESSGKIRACHNKPDTDLLISIRGILKEWQKEYGIDDDLFSMFTPMTSKEVDIKKKRVIANRNIIKDKLTIEEYKKYIEDGADPNASNGTPLNNAVRNDMFDVVEYLIGVGANPNLHDSIKYVKDTDMIKVLCKNGATLDKITYGKFVSGNMKLLEYLLDECGVDPQFDRGIIIRDACNSNDINLTKLYIEHGGDITIRQHFPIRTAALKGSFGVVDELCKEYKRLRVTKKSEEFGDIVDWIKGGTETEEDANKVIMYIVNRL